MTQKDMQEARIIRIDDEEFYVETPEGFHKVTLSESGESCTCPDFTSKKKPGFKCGHILSVINGNGNVLELKKRAKLDERFIKNIQGRDFVVYAGILDLAHQKGLQRIEVEAVQYPTAENGFEAICKAAVESESGEVFVEWGDANPKNVNPKIARHVLRMAATRAKARALRDYTNIGMTCLEELGGVDEEVDEERAEVPPPKKTGPKNGSGGGPKLVPKDDAPKQTPSKSSESESKEDGKPEKKQDGLPNGISTAQLRAIDNLSKRRGITPEELKNMLKEHYGTMATDALTAGEASSFIRLLQQSA